ncbi:MAG TPA: tRNA-binding protein [Nitrososphaerales archaeon]|nr:tRNA-binding protein [Nitrososphaerales archaeon]
MSVPFEAFSQLDIRVGRVLEIEDMPQARKPMYKLKIDVGDGSPRQCVAGIKGSYSKEQLIGKTVVAVLNLQPKSVVGVISECMLLAAFDDGGASLLSPDKDLPVGTKVG